MKLKEIHRNQAILPLQRESRVPVLSEQVGDKGLILAFRCRMTIKSVQIVEFCLNWKKSFENWQYCHYTLNQVPWVLSEQVGDKGLRRTL